MKRTQGDNQISNKNDSRSFVKPYNYENDIYPIYAGKLDSQNRPFSEYLISWGMP